MLPQQIPTTTTSTPSISASPNNNWLYAGTDEAWLCVDYSKPPYSICTEAETTAYKLPLYEEDLDCYDWSTPVKTVEQILAEVEEFKASGSPDDYDEF